MAADPTDGSTRVLVTDEGMRGIHPREFPKAFHALNDGVRFIWRSERDGWNHFYLYSLDGIQLRQLTKGDFPVGEAITVDDRAGWLYFTAQGDPERPYDVHIYRVNLRGEKLTKLTEAEGQHEARFSPSKAFFLDTHSAVGRPPAVELRSSTGTLLRTLSKTDSGMLDRLRWRPPEELVVKAADGETDLWGVLYKPYDFDPSKKYPVINVVYGWPGFVYAPHSFRAHWLQGLANFGFVVWVLDGRGTAGRGRDFRNMIFGNVGRYEVPDYTAGLKQAAAKRSYMDMDRIGVFGLSYGGYMALRAMLTAPEVYDVGVAAYPISDMAGHSTNESLFGPIEDNRAAYEYASNLPLAENLRGKLLLIHGTSDRAVPFSQTMKMVDVLVRANKHFDLMILPERGHSAGAEYWWDGVRRYFEEHL